MEDSKITEVGKDAEGTDDKLGEELGPEGPNGPNLPAALGGVIVEPGADMKRIGEGG